MLTLIEIHDTDKDHEVGGQDLPYLVTAKVERGSIDDAMQSVCDCASLEAFNVQPSERLGLPSHIEFCTFAFEDAINAFFGHVLPQTQDDRDCDRLFRVTYARTVGELRAAIADLPDNLPLVHTGVERNSVDPFACNSVNRLGVIVRTGQWDFTVPPVMPDIDGSGWGLRVGIADLSDWEQIVSGEWRNATAANLKQQ